MTSRRSKEAATEILEDFNGNNLMTNTSNLSDFLKDKFDFDKTGIVVTSVQLAEQILAEFKDQTDAKAEDLAVKLDKALCLEAAVTSGILDPNDPAIGPFNGMGSSLDG